MPEGRSGKHQNYKHKKIQNSGIGDLTSQRIVLTGGASQLPGLVEYLTQSWGKPVRVGHPLGVSGEEISKNPSFSTITGLLHYASRDERSKEMQLPPKGGHFWQRALSWLRVG